MKYSLPTTLSICLLLPTISNGEPLDGNLTLTSQAEVEAAARYTSVSGSLVISGPDISDLSPLSGMEIVGTYISVDHNPSLTTVTDGFASLTDVGWGIYFYYNENLVEFSGFDALLQTGDNIDFWFNNSLRTVSGFASLQTAGWSLEFGGNPSLTRIPEFNSLQTISSSLFILDNGMLSEITGFRALQYVDWSFQIQGNSSLNNLCGFYNYFSTNNPYTGGGAFDIVNNGNALPNPTSEQDVFDAGPCSVTAIENLRADVVSLDLSNGIEKQLTSRLDAALTAVECGLDCETADAVNALEEFKLVVERQRGKKLTEAEATYLVEGADNIIALVVD